MNESKILTITLSEKMSAHINEMVTEFNAKKDKFGGRELTASEFVEGCLTTYFIREAKTAAQKKDCRKGWRR